MGYFNWTGVILATTYETIQVKVTGMSKVDETYSSVKHKSNGLYGPVTVATRSITAGEEEFAVVHTYAELAHLYKEVQAYGRHLKDTVTKCHKGVHGRTSSDVVASYKKIMHDNCPIEDALGSILNGVNPFRGKVWLWTQDRDASTSGAGTLAMGALGFQRPPVPPRPPNPPITIPSIASASAPPRDPPPTYKEAMTEPEPAATPMPFRDYMNAYYEVNQIN